MAGAEGDRALGEAFLHISRAHQRIKPLIHRTPVLTSSAIDHYGGVKLFIKCENFQKGGAFKFRGACNAILLLSDEQKARGVITHSSGNHAQAIALAARLAGIQATVVMPQNASAVKVAATRGYGAEIVRCANTAAAREATCAELIKKHGLTYIPPYDHEHIIHGAGTAAKELIEEVGDLDVVIAPVGGGGLISGTALASRALLGDKVRVVAAEPLNADDAHRSFSSGRVEPVSTKVTLADGLRTPLSERTLGYIRRHVSGVMLVPEKEIVNAQRLLMERMKLVVEPSGAVSLAAAFRVAHEERLARSDKLLRVGVIISGGNLDLDPLFESLERTARSNM